MPRIVSILCGGSILHSRPDLRLSTPAAAVGFESTASGVADTRPREWLRQLTPRCSRWPPSGFRSDKGYRTLHESAAQVGVSHLGDRGPAALGHTLSTWLTADQITVVHVPAKLPSRSGCWRQGRPARRPRHCASGVMLGERWPLPSPAAHVHTRSRAAGYAIDRRSPPRRV